jgi:hypothetical protein
MTMIPECGNYAYVRDMMTKRLRNFGLTDRIQDAQTAILADRDIQASLFQRSSLGYRRTEFTYFHGDGFGLVYDLSAAAGPVSKLGVFTFEVDASCIDHLHLVITITL